MNEKEKYKLKRENPTIGKTARGLSVSEVEKFFSTEEKTDLQKYTFTFSLKKREK